MARQPESIFLISSVQIDDGHGEDDPLHLVVEVKGFRHENVKLKSETIRTQWIPGVNNLGIYGRWTFEEFNDVYGINKEFAALIDRGAGANTAITKNKKWKRPDGKEEINENAETGRIADA